VVSANALRRDTIVMVIAAIAFAGLAALTSMSWWLGLAFLAALAGYIFLAFRQERLSPEHGAVYDKAEAAQLVDPALDPAPRTGGVLLPLLLALAGLGVVVAGGYLLVDGAVDLATSLGVSETIIGLTIVAVGTSTPELVTSIVAAIRKQTDVAFGNLVGSNIFNILAIGGATAIASPSEVPSGIVSFDAPFMVGASLVVAVLATTGRRIDRREGAILLIGYGAYLILIWP